MLCCKTRATLIFQVLLRFKFIFVQIKQINNNPEININTLVVFLRKKCLLGKFVTIYSLSYFYSLLFHFKYIHPPVRLILSSGNWLAWNKMHIGKKAIHKYVIIVT